MSLKKRLPIFIALIVILSLGVTSIFTYVESRSIILNETKNAMEAVGKKSGDNIALMMDKILAQGELLANQEEFANFLQPEGNVDKSVLLKDANEILKQFAEKQTNQEHTFLVDRKGIIVADSNPKNIGLNLADRSYTKEALQGKSYVSETLVSKATGKQVNVFATPVTVNEETVGFIAISVFAGTFGETLKDTKINKVESSYAYLVDEKGNIIYHPTAAKIGKPVENESIKQVVTRIKQGENVKASYADYVFQGKKKLSYYEVLPKTHWVLILTGDQGEVENPVRTMTNFILIIGIIVLVVSITMGIFLSRAITNPIIETAELVDQTAQLKLGYNKNYEHLFNRKDEVGVMIKSIVEMRKVLREIVEKLLTASEIINENALEVEKLSEEVKQYAEQTSVDTETLSAGMEESAATIQEVSASSGEMENAIHGIAEKAVEGSLETKEITKRAIELKVSSIAANENATSVYENVKVELEKAISSSKSVHEINALAESILEISSQTNLLALNAAIEAARAGEHGRGFAVVAEEVRTLAEQSTETVGNIQSITQQVVSAVQSLIGSSEKMLYFLDGQVVPDYTRLIKTGEAYNDDAETVERYLLDFSAASEQLDAAANGIVKAITEMAVTINDGANGVSNIADQAINIVERLKKIEQTSAENKNSAQLLQDIVSQFKL